VTSSGGLDTADPTAGRVPGDCGIARDID
jgi:hypothetical protein